MWPSVVRIDPASNPNPPVLCAYLYACLWIIDPALQQPEPATQLGVCPPSFFSLSQAELGCDLMRRTRGETTGSGCKWEPEVSTLCWLDRTAQDGEYCSAVVTKRRDGFKVSTQCQALHFSSFFLCLWYSYSTIKHYLLPYRVIVELYTVRAGSVTEPSREDTELKQQLYSHLTPLFVPYLT